jgi:hypothetical protein
LGINSVSLKELKSCIGCYQAAPSTLFASPNKEQTHFGIRKDDISRNIMAAQFSAISALFSFRKKFNQRWRRIEITFKTIFRLPVFPDLNHPQIVTAHMAGADKTNDILTGKPAVSQYISESDTFADGAFYHLSHKVVFPRGVFIDTFLQGSMLVMLPGKTGLQFFGGHAEIASLPFFAQEGKIENHLGRPVCYGKKESLESKDASVQDMGMYPTYILNAPSRFGTVCIVNNQASGSVFVFGTDSDFRPKLEIEMIRQLPPIDLWIAQKPIENVLLATKQVA